MLALSLRNLCRVGLTLWLVFLAKLLQTPWILQETFNIPSSNLARNTSHRVRPTRHKF